MPCRHRFFLPFFAVIACTVATGFAQTAPSLVDQQSGESKEAKDARMGWWREARFGMFIHWGIYSVPAGVYKEKPVPSLGEWIMNNGNIPAAEYAKYAEQFNPTKFNADEFVAVAKNAGMKYIVITAKHHDGFAMFKSNASLFNIVDGTPFKRDVIKELDDAARKAGLRFGVYYSQSQDWNHPGGYTLDRGSKYIRDHWDPAAQDGNFDNYINKIAVPQVRELLTNYKLDVLWWDTAGDINKEQATRLHDLLALQPNIITNNRLMKTSTPGAFMGDTETPEQKIPATGFPGGRDWETCMTINDTWGFKSTDHHWKSAETLLRNLIDIASKGGNYLLNVGPTAEGEIPPESVERLGVMGKWLAVNGEAIYGTGPNSFPTAGAMTVAASDPGTTGPATTRRAATPAVVWDWRATTRLNPDGSGKIYVHIFRWPANGSFTIPGTTTTLGKYVKAYLLSDPKHTPLAIVDIVNGQNVFSSVSLPAAAPDPIATVLCIEVAKP